MMLKKLHLVNIKSHRDTTLELLPGVNAIVGPQGSGKTSIIEAIGLVLFQSLAYKQKEFIRKGSKTGMIELTFEVDKKEYKITKKMGSNAEYFLEYDNQRVDLKEEILPKIRELLKLDDNTDISVMYEQLIAPSQGTHTAPFLLSAALKKKIFDPILGIDDYEETWRHLRSVQAYSNDIISKKQSDVIRLKGLLEGLDGIKDKYELECNKREELKEQFMISDEKLELAKSELEVMDIMANKFNSIPAEEEKLKSINSNLEDFRQKIRDAKDARDRMKELEPIVKRYNVLIEQRESVRMKIAKIETTERQYSKSLSQLKDKESAFTEVKEDIAEAEAHIPIANTYDSRKQKLDSLKEQLHFTEADLAKMRKYLNLASEGMCPILEEPCPKPLKSTIEDRLDTLNQKYGEVDEKIREAEKLLKTARDARQLINNIAGWMPSINSLADDIKYLKDFISKMDEEIIIMPNLRIELSSIVTEIDKIGNPIGKYSILSNLVNSLENYRRTRDEYKLKMELQQKKIKDIKDETKGYFVDNHSMLRKRINDLIDTTSSLRTELRRQEDLVKELKIKLDLHNNKSLELSEKEKTLEIETNIKANIDMIRELMREVPPYLVSRYLLQVNYDANKILQNMTTIYDEINWMDDYELTMDGKVFKQLSGGEEMTAALCVRLALLKNLSKIDIAFFDEPTDGLDEDHRERLGDMISRISGFNQLIVISHDSAFDTIIENSIKIGKRDGLTVIG